MTLRVYNTLTRNKEEFTPLHEGKVNMYVCGVTVYDLCHLGHARAVITYDVIFRALRHMDFEVNYARNFTDVDDKIIAKANNEGTDSATVAERYIKEFYQDMDALGNLRPTFEPKATENIESMIDLVRRLVKKGYAYKRSGDVYFSIKKFKDYGKLSGRDIEDMRAGARVEVGEKKKDPMDFALWKASKKNEPAWKNPWGMGRPGWHIECSVMSMKALGTETLDIHGGGKDLIFPHHENEIAQSEAATGKPFVRYWIHNGTVTINHEKMSKSLGNFFTIREVLERYPAEAVRYLMLSVHYRSPLDYSDKALDEALMAVDRLYTAWENMDRALTAGDNPAPAESDEGLDEKGKKILGEIRAVEDNFEQALANDFNTAQANGHLFELVKIVNALSVEEEFADLPGRLPLLARAAGVFHVINGVLGSLIREPAAYRETLAGMRLSQAGLTREQVAERIAERTRAREAKDWAEADRIRDELSAKGIVLEDSKDGTTWKVR